MKYKDVLLELVKGNHCRRPKWKEDVHLRIGPPCGYLLGGHTVIIILEKGWKEYKQTLDDIDADDWELITW